MKQRSFVMFFTIVFGCFLLMHLYVGARAWVYLPEGPLSKAGFLILLVVLLLAYLSGRYLGRYDVPWLSVPMERLGAVWMATLVYLVIGLALVQLVWLIPVLSIRVDRGLADAIVALLSVIVTAWGFWNATHSTVRTYDLSVSGKGTHPELNIIVLADMHLGTLIGRERVERMVDEVNALKPDLILMPGDMVDHGLEALVNDGSGLVLEKLQSRYGVFASTGNHEFYTGADSAVVFLEKHGIRVLRDKWIKLPAGVHIVGREDVSSGRFSGAGNKNLKGILEGTESDAAVIVLDHTPVRLQEAADASVDLLLGGHTHNGQFWPWNLVTRMIYEISHGYLNKQGTHVIVSCGYGTWGPPVRIGSRSEIVQIRLKFLP